MHEKFPEDAQKYESMFREYTGTTTEVLFNVGFLALLQQRQNKVVAIHPILFEQLDLDPDEIQAAIQLLATDRHEMSRLLVKEARHVEFPWSFNTLRRYPMMWRSDGSLLILNPTFVLERICTSAFFWEIKSRLIPRSEKVGPDGSTARSLLGSFGNLLGHSAEEYAFDRLCHMEAPMETLGRRVWREEELKILRNESPTPKGCDLVIDYGSHWIAIDVVTTRLSQKAAEANSRIDLDDDIQEIVIEKAEQIDSTIRWMISNGGILPGQTSRVVVPRYFPVIVAYNGFPWNQIMARYVQSQLDALGYLHHPLIGPLMVIDIRELEHLESASELGHSLISILQGIESSGSSVHPMNWYLANNVGLKWPESLQTPFSEAFNDLIENRKPEFQGKSEGIAD